MKFIFLKNKQNNKGFSLVELLVSMAVGMIVASGIAGLLAFAVRQYRNESANVSLQYEIQTNVNQITDSIVSSQGMVIGQNNSGSEPYTDYAAFGVFKKQTDGTYKFSGEVFVAGSADANGRFNIYMDRVTDVGGATEKDAVASAVTNVKGHMSDNPNPYLLGQRASSFKVEPKMSSFDTTNNKFTNPIVVSVSLSFDKEGSGKTIHKEITDEAYMRNTVKNDVYVGTSGSEVCYKYEKE